MIRQFAKMRQQSEHNLKPCASTPENRQFDFWLGEWNVETTQGGVPAGKSKIELILGDCLVQENWQSDRNYSGQKLQRLQRRTKTLGAILGGQQRRQHFLYGGFEHGVMDYWTDEIPQPGGPALKRHLQFTKLGPDKVRQFSQGSTDGGKSWTPGMTLRM
jgi:hypothetical protein